MSPEKQMENVKITDLNLQILIITRIRNDNMFQLKETI